MNRSFLRLSLKSLAVIALGLSAAAFGAGVEESSLNPAQTDRYVRLTARLAEANKTLKCSEVHSFKSDFEPEKNNAANTIILLIDLAKTGALQPSPRAQFSLVADKERDVTVLRSIHSDMRGNSNSDFAQNSDESEVISFTMNFKMTELKSISYRSADLFRSRWVGKPAGQSVEKRTITCGKI